MQNKGRGVEILLGVVMLIMITAMIKNYGERSVASVGQVEKEKKKFTVVLDAGHGGSDSGKVGINQKLEKDINLSIVLKLKSYLEQEDVSVVLTREEDKDLFSESATNKKIDDLNKRCSIIEEATPDLAVSIHQNSYHEEEISGPQVFYYKTSEEGKKAAQCIQESFDNVIGKEENTRQIKENDNYYLLLHTKVPTIICECGFLSNGEEADKLATDEYQELIAKNVAQGILIYLKEK
jgi:N-acetylmuramoyl-L-alanine amidase